MATKKDIICEPAREDDVDELVDLCLLVEKQHEAYWSVRWQLRPDIRARYIRWMMGNLGQPRWLLLAARLAAPNGPVVLAGGLVAAITEEIPIYTYREYAFIHDLAVKPEFRRRGIARHLLEHARRWAADQGVNQLRLMAAHQNAAAVALFEKVGFRVTYHEMVWPTAAK